MYNFNLEWLVHPIRKQLFFEKYLEIQPLYIARQDPGYFQQLLTYRDVDFLLSKASNLGRLDVVLVNAGKKYQLSDYLSTVTYGNVILKRSLNLQKAFDLFLRDKATIIINQAINECSSLAELARNFSVEMNTMAGANIFIAPANAECFGAHFDEHDLFILQVHGSKCWKVYENPIYLPRLPQNFRNFDFSNLKLLFQIDLKQGDTLYLPRGFVHEVTTNDASSIHISFGGQNNTWENIAKAAIARMAIENLELRRSLVKTKNMNGVEATIAALIQNELPKYLSYDR